jgi:phage-related protein
MARTIAYQGEKFAIAFAREKSGACPAAEFFERLKPDDQAKLMVLFRMMGESGSIANREKCGTLGEGLFEFKSFQIRMPFAYAKKARRLILISHGFVKKSQRAPNEEIRRAWRILEEHEAGPGLALVKAV